MQFTVEFQERAGMPKVNREQLAKIRIIVPGLDFQRISVERYREDCSLVATLEKRAANAHARIQQTLNRIWES
jgi:hypothetical protein